MAAAGCGRNYAFDTGTGEAPGHAPARELGGTTGRRLLRGVRGGRFSGR
ncbi:hypothetical protein [Rhodosalinus sp.]